MQGRRPVFVLGADRGSVCVTSRERERKKGNVKGEVGVSRDGVEWEKEEREQRSAMVLDYGSQTVEDEAENRNVSFSFLVFRGICLGLALACAVEQNEEEEEIEERKEKKNRAKEVIGNPHPSAFPLLLSSHHTFTHVAPHHRSIAILPPF